MKQNYVFLYAIHNKHPGMETFIMAAKYNSVF